MAIETRPATKFGDVKVMLGPKRVDANVCWCLSYRLTSSKENRDLVGKGISHDLLAGAVEFARANGAPAIEGYPVDNKRRAGRPHHGVRLNGFPRVVMRLDLR
jgi:hypothetical protein